MTSAQVFRISTRRNSRKRELTARVTTDFLNYVIITRFGYFYLAYPNLTLTPIQMKRNDYGHSICAYLCARSVNNFLRNNDRRLKTSEGYWGGRPWQRVLRSRPLNVELNYLHFCLLWLRTWRKIFSKHLEKISEGKKNTFNYWTSSRKSIILTKWILQSARRC